jgi:hypothetical protein
MPLMDTETLIAHHVEALVGLGWRWEGRGLVPGGYLAQRLTADNTLQPSTLIKLSPEDSHRET